MCCARTWYDYYIDLRPPEDPREISIEATRTDLSIGHAQQRHKVLHTSDVYASCRQGTQEPHTYCTLLSCE